MVKELAFVAYFVKDVRKATAFYRDVLGLRLGELVSDDWVEFDLGSATFAIDGTGEALGIVPGTSTGAAFEVDDIRTARTRLVAGGADVSEIHEFPPCWSCFAKDPDGNRFALHQRKAQGG